MMMYGILLDIFTRIREIERVHGRGSLVSLGVLFLRNFSDTMISP
jgi:hypothetical protein